MTRALHVSHPIAGQIREIFPTVEDHMFFVFFFHILAFFLIPVR